MEELEVWIFSTGTQYTWKYQILPRVLSQNVPTYLRAVINPVNPVPNRPGKNVTVSTGWLFFKGLSNCKKISLSQNKVLSNDKTKKDIKWQSGTFTTICKYFDMSLKLFFYLNFFHWSNVNILRLILTLMNAKKLEHFHFFEKLLCYAGS